MPNEARRHLGIVGNLKLMGVRTEITVSGFTFTLSFSNDVSRTFTYGFADSVWTETTFRASVPVSQETVIEAVKLAFSVC